MAMPGTTSGPEGNKLRRVDMFRAKTGVTNHSIGLILLLLLTALAQNH